MGALNPRQTRFVAEYLKDLNATQAAIRAGYSERTAYSIGHENLNKPEIAAAIGAAQAKVAGKLELSAEKVLRELWNIREKAMATDQLAPAVRAVELCGKHIGMFVERTENRTDLTVREVVDRPSRESRREWIERRAKELGVDPRLMGQPQGSAD